MRQALKSKPQLQGSLRRVYIGLHIVFHHPSNNSIRSNQQGADAAPVLRTHAKIVDSGIVLSTNNQFLERLVVLKIEKQPPAPFQLGAQSRAIIQLEIRRAAPDKRVCVRLAVAEGVPLRQAPDPVKEQMMS
jgi:hypothetical protein